MDYRDHECGLTSDQFWFRGKRRLIHLLMDMASIPPGASILNFGAGTGEDLPVIADFGRVSVVDIDEQALGKIPSHLVHEKRIADIRSLDYPDGTFNAIVAFDVLEHIDSDTEAVASVYRMLKPEGYFILTVPALPFFFSLHDRSLGHYRRYSRKALKQLLGPFKLERLGYWMFLLFPVFALQRLIELRRTRPVMDVSKMPSIINSVFSAILGFENALLSVGFRPPIGATLFAICRKQGENR